MRATLPELEELNAALLGLEVDANKLLNAAFTPFLLLMREDFSAAWSRETGRRRTKEWGEGGARRRSKAETGRGRGRRRE